MKLKNILLLAFIYIITICFVVYFCLIYKNSIMNVNDSSIYDYVIDVTGRSYDDLYNTINNYNDEVSDYIIYVVSYRNSSADSFESMFKSGIISTGLNHHILYINVDNLKKIDYINKLINVFSFDYSIRIDSLPIFICFHDGKIVDIVSVSNFTYDTLLDYLEDIYD